MTTEFLGMKIHYLDEGEGSPILLLHGWGSSIVPFYGIIEQLKLTHRVLALDFPGCGESDLPDRPLTLNDYCDLVVKFLNERGAIDAVLIGHSHGGRVTLALTAEKRLSPPKIVLLDAAGLIPKKTFRQKARQRTFKTVKAVVSLPIFGKNSEALLNKARTHFGSADYNAAPPVMRKTLVGLVNTDLRDILPQISCPSLLIWGECDTATPLADAKTMESLIPDAGLCVVAKGSHFSFLDHPGQVNAILKSFLG